MPDSSPLDPLLAVGIVLVAWSALSSRNLFTGVVLFIVFGLLMSLAWVRLDAPDIALAEAAIGAGLTGALLLDAVGQLGRERGERRRRGAVQAAAALAATGVAALLVLAIGRLPPGPGGLTARAADALPASGVSNPVTAVLLNFRSYDTWLEVVVLLVAVIAVLSLRRRMDFSGIGPPPSTDAMLGGVARTLLPVMVLTGGYLLWRGTSAPGGAFQGGAVLGSAGVLLILAGYRPLHGLKPVLFRGALMVGLGGFLLAALGTLAAGGPFLSLPPEYAGRIILAVEVTVTLSIALTLTALFAGASPQAPETRKGADPE
jgi:multisubunit Na+/H+ antiporter MnhB subunit